MEFQSPEILALKRAVVAGGCSPAHSCVHCAALNLPSIPKSVPLVPLTTLSDQNESNKDGGQAGPFRYSRTHAKQCADSGCAWWLFIHKQIRRHELVCAAKSKWRVLVAGRRCLEQDHSEQDDDEIEQLESVFLTFAEAELLEQYLDKRGYEELLQLAETENLFNRVCLPSPSRELLSGDDVDFIWLSYSIKGEGTVAQLVLYVELALVASWDHDKMENSRRSFELYFQVLAQPGDLGLSIETTMPVNVNPGSPSSIALLSHWMRHCESHGCGFDELPSSMPTMLLDVQDLALEKRVKVIEVPASMKERYIALSYCWGAQGQKVINIRETRRDLLTGMPMGKLDLSIQDAIQVTRELGFRYIWIDALCIPQDDPEAKGREIASMAEIYESSTFTIYASRAQTVQEGFLSKRDPAAWGQDIQYGQQVVFQSRTGVDGQASCEATVTLIPQLDFSDENEGEPLQNRAWTLQELILPPRRLSFGTRQTTWTCLHHHSDQLRDGWTEVSGTQGRQNDAAHVNASTIVQSTTAMTQELILENWYKLVELYSSREISFKSDRLPAISALARVYSRKLEDDYLGGHWKSTFPIELISLDRHINHRRRSGLPRKPTWSWSSHPGRISWDKGEFVQDSHFVVLDCHIDYATTSDVFGAIDGAKLRVRGLLYHAPPEIMHRDIFGEPRQELARNVNKCSSSELQSLFQMLNLNNSRINYDCEEAQFNQDDAYPNFYESLHLLLIACKLRPHAKVELHKPHRSCYGLVLYHHNDDTFSRVGNFVLCKSGIFDEDGKILKSILPNTDQSYNEFMLEMWQAQVREITIV